MQKSMQQIQHNTSTNTNNIIKIIKQTQINYNAYKNEHDTTKQIQRTTNKLQRRIKKLIQKPIQQRQTVNFKATPRHVPTPRGVNQHRIGQLARPRCALGAEEGVGTEETALAFRGSKQRKPKEIRNTMKKLWTNKNNVVFSFCSVNLFVFRWVLPPQNLPQNLPQQKDNNGFLCFFVFYCRFLFFVGFLQFNDFQTYPPNITRSL